jgi:hypothetical protein
MRSLMGLGWPESNSHEEAGHRFIEPLKTDVLLLDDQHRARKLVFRFSFMEFPLQSRDPPMAR